MDRDAHAEWPYQNTDAARHFFEASRWQAFMLRRWDWLRPQCDPGFPTEKSFRIPIRPAPGGDAKSWV